MRATSGVATGCLLVSRRDVETGQRGVLAGPTASTWGERALAASVRLSDAGVHPLSRVFLLQLSPKVGKNHNGALPNLVYERALLATDVSYEGRRLADTELLTPPTTHDE